jgi:serine/threonine protein kinase
LLIPPSPTVDATAGKNGFKLSDFDLGLEIGRGIGGSVRRAYHRQQKREFALKEINVSSSSPRHQMIKELSAHAECGDMRNIVRLYDVFYDEGLVYLVLELVSWGSVRVSTRHLRHAS